MKKKRISIRRRSGKIGFLGKGMRAPASSRSEIVDSLSARLDKAAVGTEVADLETYREDARIEPRILRHFFSKRPKAVVRPDSGELVADILDKCLEERTPAVPRGAGSVGLGGAVPVRGGVVMDLTGTSGIREVDRTRRSVSVEAGCRWTRLRDALAGEGLALRSYPGGAAFGTVGGWASAGGLGVGTHACGSFGDQLSTMEAAAPSGILIDAGRGHGRYSIRSFLGAEGQTGVITGLTFPVKDLPERRTCLVIHLKQEPDGFGVIESFARMENPALLVRMANAGMARVLANRWGLAGPSGPFVIVADEGPPDRVGATAAAVQREAAIGGREIENLDDRSGPVEAWFSHLDEEGRRATVLSGEVLLATGQLPAFVDSLTESDGCDDLLWEATLVAEGLAMIRVMRLEDVGPGSLIRDVPVTARVVTLAVRLGGMPYGLGIWNSRHSRLVLGDYYRELMTIKRETDRIGILNPGKFFGMTTNSGIPVPGWMLAVGVRLAGGT